MYAYILYITKPSFDWFLFHVEYLIYWMKWQKFIREIVDFIRKYLSKKCIEQTLVILGDLRKGRTAWGTFSSSVNSEAWLNIVLNELLFLSSHLLYTSVNFFMNFTKFSSSQSHSDDFEIFFLNSLSSHFNRELSAQPKYLFPRRYLSDGLAEVGKVIHGLIDKPRKWWQAGTLHCQLPRPAASELRGYLQSPPQVPVLSSTEDWNSLKCRSLLVTSFQTLTKTSLIIYFSIYESRRALQRDKLQNFLLKLWWAIPLCMLWMFY